jgi:Transposase IS66 family
VSTTEAGHPVWCSPEHCYRTDDGIRVHQQAPNRWDGEGVVPLRFETCLIDPGDDDTTYLELRLRNLTCQTSSMASCRWTSRGDCATSSPPTLMEALLGVSVSTGFVGRALERFAQRLATGGFDDARKTALRAEDVLCADETPTNVIRANTDAHGEPVAGSPHAVTVRTSDARLVYYAPIGSRSKTAIADLSVLRPAMSIPCGRRQEPSVQLGPFAGPVRELLLSRAVAQRRRLVHPDPDGAEVAEPAPGPAHRPAAAGKGWGSGHRFS